MDSGCADVAEEDNGGMKVSTEFSENEIVEAFKSNFPEAVLEAKVQRKGRILITVKKERLMDASIFLKEKLEFDHIASVSGLDYPDRNEFEVVYHIYSITKKTLAEVKVAISRNDAKLPSLIPVWPGINYHERETWEMFGIEFQGHPNLTRFLLPEEWDKIPPFRKDFKLPTAPKGTWV